MQIVIANSVGVESSGRVMIHSPSRWTASSSDIKTFTYYPWELAYTSSLLKRDTKHDIIFVDGCLEKLNAEEYFDKISAYEPDFLVMESSTRTIDEDQKVAIRLKEKFGTKLIFCGQHATAYPEEILKFADYACIGEYEYTVLDIVSGKKNEEILGIYPNGRRELLDINSLPWPEDSDVSRLDYSIPGEPSCEFVELQAYGSRGCPCMCSFCVASNLYYSKPNWRPRNVTDLVNELRVMRMKYPALNGVFFDEEAHNVKKSYILDLCRELKSQGMDDFNIDAMCTYFSIDEEMLINMKQAGYYMLRVGIETASEKVAKNIRLGGKFNIDKLRSVLYMAKDIGIKMYGTFTFGAPGSNLLEDEKTLRLMDELVTNDLLWRYQVSICTPQPGTPFFNDLKTNSMLADCNWRSFDGGNTVVSKYPNYSGADIERIYKQSQKYYDIGFAKRFHRRIKDSVMNLNYTDVNKILVFRSSRIWQLKDGIKLLKEKYPEASIVLLGQESVKDDFDDMSQIDEYIVFGDGYFNKNTFPEEIEDLLKEECFDLSVVFYNNSRGNGYEDIKDLASSIGAKEKISFNLDGEFLEQ